MPRCPVGGMLINLAHSVVTDDGPVFFCCEHCIEKFRANPSQYGREVEELRGRLKELPSVQVTCPVSGSAVDRSIFIEEQGVRVFFCSEECRSRFLGAPESYRPRIAGTLWYQTRCPVTGNEIDPRQSAVLKTGERVYFCSEACKEKFLQNPEAWASKLVDQGLRLHL